MESDKQTIIIDNGSCFIKCGLSNEIPQNPALEHVLDILRIKVFITKIILLVNK